MSYIFFIVVNSRSHNNHEVYIVHHEVYRVYCVQPMGPKPVPAFLQYTFSVVCLPQFVKVSGKDLWGICRRLLGNLANLLIFKFFKNNSKKYKNYNKTVKGYFFFFLLQFFVLPVYRTCRVRKNSQYLYVTCVFNDNCRLFIC